jgi:hypothetical protein
MESRKRKLSLQMWSACLFLSVCLTAGCEKEVTSPPQAANNTPSQLAVASSTSTSTNSVKFFDSELDQRRNLSAYTKTSSALSAMVINPSRISVVNDPYYGSKRKVMSMNVRLNDNGGVTANPRAQVQTPMSYAEGQEVYIGFSVRFTKTFWTYFLTFSELYGAPYKGTAPFRLAVQESNIVASSFDGKKQLNLWKQPMQANVWYDFVYREVLSKDATKGEVQVWLRKSGEKEFKEILPTQKMATITAANITGPNYHKLACYYDKTNTFTDATKKSRVSSVQMYFANHKVGSSFSQVSPALLVR